jgi:hypothetical protein
MRRVDSVPAKAAGLGGGQFLGWMDTAHPIRGKALMRYGEPDQSWTNLRNERGDRPGYPDLSLS